MPRQQHIFPVVNAYLSATGTLLHSGISFPASTRWFRRQTIFRMYDKMHSPAKRKTTCIPQRPDTRGQQTVRSLTVKPPQPNGFPFTSTAGATTAGIYRANRPEGRATGAKAERRNGQETGRQCFSNNELQPSAPFIYGSKKSGRPKRRPAQGFGYNFPINYIPTTWKRHMSRAAHSPCATPASHR